MREDQVAAGPGKGAAAGEDRGQHTGAAATGKGGLVRVGTLRPTRCRRRLFGEVEGQPVFVARSGRTSFTIHESPPLDPAIERFGREGGNFIYEGFLAGLVTVDGSTGDPGLDRLAHEGGAKIISLDPDPEAVAMRDFARRGGAHLLEVSHQIPLPRSIGWLSWRRGRRCGLYLAGAIRSYQVLVFREPDGSWSVHRRGDTRIVVERKTKDANDDGGPGSAVISDSIRNRSAPVYQDGKLISGTPWPADSEEHADPDMPTHEELITALPGACVVELLTPAALRKRGSE